jgi:hypothetical protein
LNNQRYCTAYHAYTAAGRKCAESTVLLLENIAIAIHLNTEWFKSMAFCLPTAGKRNIGRLAPRH